MYISWWFIFVSTLIMFYICLDNLKFGRKSTDELWVSTALSSTTCLVGRDIRLYNFAHWLKSLGLKSPGLKFPSALSYCSKRWKWRNCYFWVTHMMPIQIEIHIKSSTYPTSSLLEMLAVPKIFFLCKICRFQFGLIILDNTAYTVL